MLSLVFTPLTQTTIAVLYDIANGVSFNYLKDDGSSMLSLSDIVLKLEAKNIIRLKAGQTEGDLSSYELTLPVHLIPLLDILEAIEERIDYDKFIPEIASRFKGHIANDTEAVKRMIHAYLETVKLANLGKKQCSTNQLPINEK